MDSSARMRQRSDKLRDQLDSLKKEVTVANVLLQQILDRAFALVEQMETAKSPQIYFREYAKVQKFLLKYVNYVTEINCDLELKSEEDDFEIQLEVFAPPVENVRQGREDKEAVIDPKMEFKEKVKKLAEGELKVSKSWTDAPAFVPKIAPEAPAFVPNVSPDAPAFVPKVAPDAPAFVPKVAPEAPAFVPKVAPDAPAFVPKVAPQAPEFVPKVSSNTSAFGLDAKSNGIILPKIPAQGALFLSPPPQIRPMAMAPPPPNPFQLHLVHFANPAHSGMLQMQGLPLWKQEVPMVQRRPVKIEPPATKVSIKEIVETEVEKDKKTDVPIEKTEVMKEVRPPEVEEVKKPEAKVTPEVKKEEVRKPESKAEDVRKPEAKAEDVKKPESKTEVVRIPEEKDDEIPEMDISREPGAKYQVVFDHLVSPGEFYIQILCPALRGMREMCKEIETHFKTEKLPEQPYQAKNRKNTARKELARRIVGRYGLCFTVDDPSWGRVEIKDWKLNEDDDSVTVFFVDYGDTKPISLMNLQPILPRFKKYPKFAQRCHLTNVYPPEAEAKKPMPPWSTPSITMFEILLETMPNDFSCHIIVGENDGCYVENSLPVNFFVIDGGVSTSVNDRMVEFEAAKLLDEPPLPPDPNYSEANRRRSPVGALDVATSQNLQVGEILSIQVTCLLKLNRFYCVKECGDAEEDFLSKLVSFMNKSENVDQMLPLTEPPPLDHLVVGKYKEDNLWYRAKILRADPVSDRYKLLFLDYGNTEILPLKDIRKMEKKFLGFPFQLIECYLQGIEPAEEATSEEAMKYFFGKVETGGLSVKICKVVCDKTNCYEVELYNQDGEDIGEDLVASKFAVRKRT